MHATAKQLYTADARIQHTKVVSEDEGTFLLDDGQYRFHAKRAVGCLLSPVVGDLVLASVDTFGEAYILNILEREQQAGEVVLPAQTTIHASGKLQMSSPELSVVSAKADVNIAEARYTGNFMQVTLQHLKNITKNIELFSERFSLRSTWSQRIIEKADDTQAGMSRTLVDGLLTMQTENTIVTSKDSVKIDAEQLHLG